jgi:hypothetical protein
MARRAGRADEPETGGQRARPALGKEERIAHCFELMTAGLWVTGATAVRLAAEWGLAVSTVEHDSAEASRRVHAALDDKHLRARIQATLETNTGIAMNRGQLRTAVESVKALAGISGAEAPKKLEVAAVTLDDLDQIRKAAESNECSSSEPKSKSDSGEPNS